MYVCMYPAGHTNQFKVHVEYMDPALKIQMALSSHKSNLLSQCSNISDHSSHFSLHFSPFPAHIGLPLTPLLTPFRKYYKSIIGPKYHSMISRGFATYNRIMPAMLQSNRFVAKWTNNGLISFRYSTDFSEVGILGQGGFGSVYQARNLIDGVHYAVKKISLSTNAAGLNDITDHKVYALLHS